MIEILIAVVQSQKAISAYFTSYQILPFGIAEQSATKNSLETSYFYQVSSIVSTLQNQYSVC